MTKRQKPANKKITRPPQRRRTIGFLTGYRDKFFHDMWRGVADVAREHNVNAISFVGEYVRDSEDFRAQDNILYNLVNVERLDGLAIWGLMVNMLSPDAAKRFYKSYQPLPIVSVAQPMAGFTSVLVDNYGCMREVISHLIEAHGCRRIAYIKGLPNFKEHDDRYQAYMDALAEHGIPFDPARVAVPRDGAEMEQPDWGLVALSRLLDKQNADFDALVTNDDYFAHTLLPGLQARGIRIPDDIALASFDDMEGSNFFTPPLTTVPFPMYELGRLAAETLLAQLDGQEALEQVYVPARLIIRQSCGCLNPKVVQAAAGPVVRMETAEPFESVAAVQRERILTEMARAAGISTAGLNPEWLKQLLDGFVATLTASLTRNAPVHFLSTLDRILHQVMTEQGDVEAWQNILSSLRRQLLPYLGVDEAGVSYRDRAEDMWLQAQVMVSEVVQRAQAYRELQAERRKRVLSDIGTILITNFDSQQLADSLAQGLPRLGILKAYLSLYENPHSYRYPQPAPEWSRLILAYDAGRAEISGNPADVQRVELEPGGRRFPSRQLVPEGILSEEEQYTLVAHALYFHNDQIGFILFDGGQREGDVYYTLRAQISSALKGALLLQARQEAERSLERAYAEVERQVLERTAELRREIVERERAQDALHESQALYYSFIEQLPNPVFRKDSEGRYVMVNSQFCRLKGVNTEDFLGRTSSEVAIREAIRQGRSGQATKYAAEGEQVHELIMRTGKIVETEEEYPDADGEKQYMHVIRMPVFDPEGKVVGTQGIQFDITERRNAEQALRESEERYRLLVNLSPDSIAIHSQGRIVFVNPAMVRMQGAKSEADLVGISVLDIIHPDFRDLFKKHIDTMLSTGNPLPFSEEKFFRLDGSSVEVEVAGVPYQSQGTQYVQIVAREITERKHHEREREAIIAVSNALRKATTRTEILTVILDQVLELFVADGSMLALPNPITGGATIEIGRGVVGKRFAGLNIPAGKGVSGWVIANKKSYLNNNADIDPLFYHSDLLGDSHCVASVPLIAQERAIGALWIARKNDITEQDVRLLNAIADIAANAIHRVTLYERTEQQLHHLIALHQIDIAISTNFDISVILNVILNNVKDELEVDAASILLLDPVTHTLDYAAGIGYRTRGIERSHVKLGDGYAGTAALEYRTVSCPDLRVARGTFSRSSLLADEEFISHYATPLVVKGQVKGVLELFHRKTFERESEWISYFETLATQSAIAIESASLFENLQRSNMELTLAYDATIEGWSRALDLRDRETEGHTQRVTEMVLELAEKMGLSDSEKLNIKRGALLHDIGKMGVPDSVLLKPGPLTEREWEVMRQHPLYAYQMLSPITYLKHALDIPYCHHEKWDGSGYPRGLKGEEIPLPARMFVIVDVFDALTSDRPYREAWSQQDVLHYIQEQAGRHFDPQVVKIFLETRR